jgi:hypothetical protein
MLNPKVLNKIFLSNITCHSAKYLVTQALKPEVLITGVPEPQRLVIHSNY